MRRWNMIIDVAKCEDCNNCLLACKDEHVGNEWPGYAAAQPLHGHRWMNISRKERGSFPLIDVAYRPTPCMHCDNPPCEVEAKDGAVAKRADGVVIVDPEKAKGQRWLVKACPYGAIYWNEEKNIPQKCTFCAHLLDDGWDKPRCVQSCPTGALTAVRVEDDEMSAWAAVDQLETLQPEKGTRPRVYYKNLHRFEKCFIGGTVSYTRDGLDECAAGAKVTLTRDGEPLALGETDCFGGFKFDGLERGSGPYSIVVTFSGREKRVDFELSTDSMTLGNLAMT